MKTLIIHPQDNSTEFLTDIYKDIEDKTVIKGGVSKSELREAIKSHDRVMMMGHGGHSGLFKVGNFKMFEPFLIDSSTVELLNEKSNSIFIWCNADGYVNKYKLGGFYTGMFISEVGEAYYCGLPTADQEMVDESNHGFCNIINKYINEDKEVIFEKVKREYGELARQNPVAFYNWLRLYKQ